MCYYTGCEMDANWQSQPTRTNLDDFPRRRTTEDASGLAEKQRTKLPISQ